ncbi:MAG: LPS-assembly protein LptD [Nitrospirae bacterium]|nr:LPS-assembly protein LptD [Nitrospirota bacterium]
MRQRIKTCIILLLAACGLLSASYAFAEGQVNITADRLEYLSQTNVYEAKGSVRIEFEDKVLTADEMRLDGDTSDAFASGNVVYEDPETVVRADRMDFNLKTKIGTVHNSYLYYKKQNFHLHGDDIKKTGDKSFYLDRACVTTCDGDAPAWHIEGKDIEATQDKSLSAWHARLYLRNVPVLYTPYFWAPLTKERQTGFIFPYFGYSSARGSYYKQGFYWAIREDQDASIYLDYYAKNKLAEGLDYRYALTPRSNGEFWIYHAKDNAPVRDLFEVKSHHNLELPHSASAYLKLHNVSKFDYYKTLDSTSLRRYGLASQEVNPFGFASEERLQKYLESDLHVSRPFNAGRVYLLGRTRQSLEGSSDEIPRSLPEIGFVVNTMSRGPFSFNSAVTGVNFRRKEGQQGMRFDINPNFFFSRGKLVNFTQRIGLRDTAYFLDAPAGTENRLLFDLSSTLTTRLARKYSSVIHIVEPSVEYEHVPAVDHDNIPFFDSVDSIPQKSGINYSLTNRVSGLSPLRLESRFRLSQNYSLLNIEKHFSPILAEAVLTSGNVDLSVNASYDVHEGEVAETIASFVLKNGKGYVGVGENFRRSSSLEQVTFEAGVYRPGINGRRVPVDLRGKLWYDMKGNGVQQFNVTTTYLHQCWGLAVSYTGRPDEFLLAFTVEFRGLGSLQLGNTASTSSLLGLIP